MNAFVGAFLDAHFEELVAFRRHLHAYPELSGEERQTTEHVAERLLVAGLEPHALDGGVGLWCDVGAGDGPLVALRADMDALAMDDEKDVPYRSRVPGVAHACGHDVHTTVVLGAGLALTRRLGEPDSPGRVRLVFEPAEETVPGGAVDVIAAGVLDGVQAIFGVHCDPKLDVGNLGVRAGPITSAADMIDIRLHGPGGHTARPELTVDLVALAGRIAVELPRRAQELAAPHGALRVVFGALHTGDAPNVIPATARLRGSVRTPDREAWDAADAILTAALAELVGSTDAEWHLEHQRGVPPVVNDARMTDLLAAAARAELGEHAVVATPQSAGGDSFSWYLERVPGSYGRLGVHDPASPVPRLDLHASTFDVDERAIGVGVRVLCRAALDALERSSSSSPD